MMKRDGMPFINSFTVNAGTLPKWQKNSWRRGPLRCDHLLFHWNQEVPQQVLLSTPAPMEIQMPDLEGSCSTSQNALYGWLKIQNPRIRLMSAEKKPHQTGWRWSREVSGSTTVLPCHRDSGALLYCCLLLAHSKKGTTNQNIFKRCRTFRCCPRQHMNSLRSAYIHLHVKLPSGVSPPPAHLLYV